MGQVWVLLLVCLNQVGDGLWRVRLVGWMLWAVRRIRLCHSLSPWSVWPIGITCWWRGWWVLAKWVTSVVGQVDLFKLESLTIRLSISRQWKFNFGLDSGLMWSITIYSGALEDVNISTWNAARRHHLLESSLQHPSTPFPPNSNKSRLHLKTTCIFLKTNQLSKFQRNSPSELANTIRSYCGSYIRTNSPLV